MKFPTHVAVDTRDGYVFYRGQDGELFNSDSARKFADKRNAELKQPTYYVFGLVPTRLSYDETQRKMVIE